MIFLIPVIDQRGEYVVYQWPRQGTCETAVVVRASSVSVWDLECLEPACLRLENTFAWHRFRTRDEKSAMLGIMMAMSVAGVVGHVGRAFALDGDFSLLVYCRGRKYAFSFDTNRCLAVRSRSERSSPVAAHWLDHIHDNNPGHIVCHRYSTS